MLQHPKRQVQRPHAAVMRADVVDDCRVAVHVAGILTKEILLIVLNPIARITRAKALQPSIRLHTHDGRWQRAAGVRASPLNQWKLEWTYKIQPYNYNCSLPPAVIAAYSVLLRSSNQYISYVATGGAGATAVTIPYLSVIAVGQGM